MAKLQTHSNDAVLARLHELRDDAGLDPNRKVTLEVTGGIIKTLYVTLEGFSATAVIVLGHLVPDIMDTSLDVGKNVVHHVYAESLNEMKKYGKEPVLTTKAAAPLEEQDFDTFLKSIR